jgi:hypothetical protein
MIPCSINPEQDASVDTGLIHLPRASAVAPQAVLEQLYSVISVTNN